MKPQSVMDAEADALQLELVAADMSFSDDVAYGVWALLAEADTSYDEWPVERCARAAFLAVPELRG